MENPIQSLKYLQQFKERTGRDQVSNITHSFAQNEEKAGSSAESPLTAKNETLNIRVSASFRILFNIHQGIPKMSGPAL